ncbi:DUF6884 domain-containing protein [Streptomyces sp. CA-111067]|uniref:DUF6884 domain-containing protein n=1 Tax=Streptomyces sp. CA-111067 TaxID=3240046 RepID=UPI003D99CE11
MATRRRDPWDRCFPYEFPISRLQDSANPRASACGSAKAEPSWEEFGYRDVIPAGRLYTGPYHRSLRLAAAGLTDQTLIRILSAQHGLVPLDRPLFPYDTRLGDRDVVTPERVARQTAALDLDDARVIFLGGRG